MAKILQLKISLIDSKIWRRFLVKDSINFEKLHNIIQEVMGWGNYHLFEFKFGNIRIVPSDEGYLEEDELDPKKAKIEEYVNKEKQKFKYVYDFGDSWEHKIVVEKIMDEDTRECPICLEGEMACPPEDCGGISGYERFLEILKTGKDPWKENVEELKNWLGDWNPDKFNLEKINARLKKIK